MRVTSELMCRRCGSDTVHEVHYAGPVLHEARCTRCGLENSAHRRPIKWFVKELRERTTSKPARLVREIFRDPRSLCSLPARVLSKPVRVASEIIEVLH